ncbi:MAG: hypothetical protein IKC17_04300 [Bacteroidales bacterium]|nr:hypothetical protein [Bacteroidales bacterium]
MKETLDEPIYYEEYEEVAAELSKGHFAKCIVRGKSMLPFFKLGEDYLVLAPIKNGDSLTPANKEIIDRHNNISKKKKRNFTAAHDRMTLRRRDIVMFKYRFTGTYRLMRVVHIWGTLLLLRGDGCYGCYERATVSDVLGIAVYGTFKGGKEFITSSRRWRTLSKWWTGTYRLRLWLRKFKKQQI